MFGINGWEALILIVLGVVILGPERLPEYAVKLAQLVRKMRIMAEGAKVQLKDQLGPEYQDINWRQYDPRQYDPRRIVREALQEPLDFVAEPFREVRDEVKGITDEVKAIRDGSSTALASTAVGSTVVAPESSLATAAVGGTVAAAAMGSRTASASRPSPSGAGSGQAPTGSYWDSEAT